MKIAVLKEAAAGECRVAATPETVKKFIGLGASLFVEKGAGAGASISDADYEAAGATLGTGAATVKDADIVLGVQGPDPKSLKGVKAGAWIVAGLDPFGQRARVDDYARAGVEALAMEFMPRITRAQSMDILSSQSNLAGYKAVIDAAGAFGRAFPMMMTAAGTVSAARAFIMGVGVAGLQAIATARRLGAQVSATDVRSATKEQIESLGAKAIFVENVAGIEGEGAGGYATEMSDEYKAAQAELVSSHIAKQDIVITTALIPGRAAPRLITDAQIKSMKPGSVIFDLAVAQGGNVEGSKADEVVVKHGVKILGYSNTPAHLAADTSALFARNLFNFLSAFWDKDAGRPVLPDDDEITAAIRLTKSGKVVNERLLGRGQFAPHDGYSAQYRLCWLRSFALRLARPQCALKKRPRRFSCFGS
ncbi:MAG: NAD(P) transhydrogenase subunit alpha [Sphingomonadales bacterium]|nr:NAD(P) transhydrogenase subunit alpha [Sphingomonadales bacterium]